MKRVPFNTHTYAEQRLLKDIEITKMALESAYSNFENVTDPDLIDCYIFEVNSIQKRYKFLLNQAKDIGVKCLISTKYNAYFL